VPQNSQSSRPPFFGGSLGLGLPAEVGSWVGVELSAGGALSLGFADLVGEGAGLAGLSDSGSRLRELLSSRCRVGLGFGGGALLLVAVGRGSEVRDSRTRGTVVGLTVTVGSTDGSVVSSGREAGDSEGCSGCSAVVHWAPDEHEVAGVVPVEEDIIHPLASPTITIPPTAARSSLLLRLPL
jgi:hypothetical protein